jgi:hypothetical protein
LYLIRAEGAMREHDEPWKTVRRDRLPAILQPSSFPRSRRWLIAASLATLPLLTLILYLNSRIRDLSSPQPELAVLTLSPEGEAHRGTLDQKTETLPAGTSVTLILASLGGPHAFPSYELLLEDDSGRALWSVPGARRGSDGAITLSIPLGLPPGNYLIKVAGVEDGRIVPQEHYRFSVGSRGP